MIRLLLGRGADINLQTKTGRTPLHSAVESRQVEGVFSLLLERGARLDIKDNDQLTAWELASNQETGETLPQKSLAILEQAVKESEDATQASDGNANGGQANRDTMPRARRTVSRG